MFPKFGKKIVTAELTPEDADILHGHVYGEDGKPLTKAQILADKLTRRIVAHRNIDTGEMETTVHARTHDGKPLPYFVVQAQNLHPLDRDEDEGVASL